MADVPRVDSVPRTVEEGIRCNKSHASKPYAPNIIMPLRLTVTRYSSAESAGTSCIM